MTSETTTTRDPVRKSITVACSVETAFEVWTSRMGTWWPLSAGHSVAPDDAETVVVEGRVGGRIFERTRQGVEHDWGEVLVWEPPTRLVHSWHPGYERARATEVEVRFSDLGGGRTAVELEHRGWDRLSAEHAAARDGYDEGWVGVIARFAEAANSA